jgi:hypothetical protein
MNKNIIIGISTLGVVLVFGLIYFSMSISYKNQYVEIHNQLLAQEKSCKAVYDNMWKVISQKAQVSEKYKDAFKEIYPQLIEGRYGNEKGGSLMKFIVESNPSFDISLYKDLSQSIEAERNRFTNEQKMLIDIKREEDNLLQRPISGFFLSDKKPYEIKVITSSKTEKVFDSGKDDDVKVF